nr:glycerophosphocholine phosphodiesterase GPCPD1-like isoform X4 [Bombyx mori]
MFKPSEGNLELPVTCNVKHRPLGTVNFGYLTVCPIQEKLCNLQVSYAKYWDSSWTGLEVGHRGLGASFKTKEGNAIRENTIASLKKAAASGADLLEFDVQLSKDMIPVIYHDFYVCISMKRKKEIEFTEMLELPVKDLTLEHLQKLKVYHLVEGRSKETLFFDDDLDEHQPFPTLEDALKAIDIHVGFNVELKWTMEMNDGTFELNNPFDMNTYVDKVLEVVLKHAGERRIVFSCFNPDICTMVRNKQNKYPVMFLTVGITNKYQPYRDPRCLSIPAAVQSAVSSDLLGIVVHTEDLLRDPTQP